MQPARHRGDYGWALESGSLLTACTDATDNSAIASHVFRLPFSLDPLIAAAKRLARGANTLLVSKRKVSLGLAVTVLVLAGTSSGAAGTRTSIALDHRIGPVLLNEPRAQVTKALGRGVPVHLEGNRFRFYWKVGIYVLYPKGPRQRAAIIETRSAQYTTRSGVRVGSSLRALRHAVRVKCHRSGQSIQCYHGLNGPSRPGTSFLINGATKRVTRIALAYGI